MRVFNASSAGLADIMPKHLLLSHWSRLEVLDLSSNHALKIIPAELSRLRPEVRLLLHDNDQIHEIVW